MFDGTTLIVDVLTLGENSYALSLPAEDLWVAYEVVRRHVDANGVRHYSQMTEAKTTTDGYSFKFDTGDTFTCPSHLDQPTSSTLSDEQGGGSGGVVFAVNLSLTNESGSWVATLDKTYAEIDSAYKLGQIVLSTVTVDFYVGGEHDRTLSMTGALVVYLDEVNGNSYAINAQDASAEENIMYAYSIYIDEDGIEVYDSQWIMNT